MAFIRRTNLHVERRLDLATQAGRTPEGMMHFGAALHAIEDLFAHSNWVEIAVSRVLSQNQALLPDLHGADRQVFTYTPNVNVGHNSVMGPGNRPVMTTGSFTGTDTQISIGSELYGLFSRPLEPPHNNAEALVDQGFVTQFLRSFEGQLNNADFQNGLRGMLAHYHLPGMAVDAVASVPLEQMYTLTRLPMVPDWIKRPIQDFIRNALSTRILQPMSRVIQEQALNARISSTSLIEYLRENRNTQNQQTPSAAALPKMELIRRLRNIPIEVQQATARDEARRHVADLEQTPEAVLAGPSHSQISKDHANSPFFGLAFTVANAADRRMRDRMIAAWNEHAGGVTRPFDFSFPNFPQVPAGNTDANNARDLYHQSRPRIAHDTVEQHEHGNRNLEHGGDGPAYSLSAMRGDSANQVNMVADAFTAMAESPRLLSVTLSQMNNILGRILPGQLASIRRDITTASAASANAGRGATADELRAFALQLRNLAAVILNARTYEQRATVHQQLIQKRSEAITLLARSTSPSAHTNEAAAMIVMLEDQIANTENTYLPEQRTILQGGHVPGLLAHPVGLSQSTVTLPNASQDFAGHARGSAQTALINESRVLLNHPYESNWWVEVVTHYIHEHSDRILQDIEARNQGVPTFRRVGERPGQEQ